LRSKYRNNLIGTEESKIDNLVELNVMQQVVNVGRLPVIQRAWRDGQKVNVHGVVYNLKDGILKDLGLSISEV
jgi:carbonic anhydrase